MVIDGSEGEDAEAGDDVAGQAYREAITSADGFTRGPNGRIKFNKDTKKRRLENMQSEDVEMSDADGGSAKKAKRRQDAKFGHEFKAKVFGSPSSRMQCSDEAMDYRKRVEILKRVEWIPMPIFLFRRRRRGRVERSDSEWRARSNAVLPVDECIMFCKYRLSVSFPWVVWCSLIV